MPITQATSITATISTIYVDMVAMTMAVTFNRSVNGVALDSPIIMVPGTSLETLLATQATAGQALGSEITAAIYNYAVANSQITGVVS